MATALNEEVTVHMKTRIISKRGAMFVTIFKRFNANFFPLSDYCFAQLMSWHFSLQILLLKTLRGLFPKG